RAQRRPGVHRLPRAAAAAGAYRLGGHAGACRPGQGRRRAAPDQSGPAGARWAGPVAVHAARHRRGAAPVRCAQRRGGRVAWVIVVARGVTVGRPLGLLLTRRTENAPVTLCHTGTRDLSAELRRADIVVAAAGRPGLVTADAVQPGAAVLDVGITRTEQGLVG